MVSNGELESTDLHEGAYVADFTRHRYFPDSVRDDYAAGQLDAQVEGVLQEMRELSICGAA